MSRHEDLSIHIPKWALIIELLSGYELESALKYSLKGCPAIILANESQVRAGSVIFLVGVGSLVCWKIWDHLANKGAHSQDGDSPSNSPPPKPPSGFRFVKSPSKAAKNLLTTLLEEEFLQDFGDFEDEDPGLIQQLFDLGRLYIRNLIVGKYFGPDDPIEGCFSPEDFSPLSSESCDKVLSNASTKYHADHSANFSAADDDEGCQTSDFDEENLPYDDLSCNVAPRTHRHKLRKKPGRLTGLLGSHSSSPSMSPHRMIGMSVEAAPYDIFNQRFHPYLNGKVCYPDHLQTSSESSPRGAKSLLAPEVHSSVSRNVLRCDGDGSETPDSAQVGNKNSLHHRPEFGLDEGWLVDRRLQPEGEEVLQKGNITRNASLNEMIGKVRHRAYRRASLPRNNSSLCDYLVSPGSKGRCFPRDDSVCSNLSDVAFSECSEFSLDISLKDESFTNRTITNLFDIEQELDILKSSVLEMDEEYLRFASQPNPYLLKTTFSESSLVSEESRPNSSLEIIHNPVNFKSMEPVLNVYSEDKKDNAKSTTVPSSASQCSEVEAASLEWDSPQHGWSTLKKIPFKYQRRSSSVGGLSRTSTQDEFPLSLEWDNEYIKQYEEEEEHETCVRSALREEVERQTFLPDHASLELDLEEELRSPTTSQSGGQIFSDLNTPSISATTEAFKFEFSGPRSHSLPRTALGRMNEPRTTSSNVMTASIDSAICSAPGSRSGSSSPMPSFLSQSMMSSGIAGSLSEISPNTPEAEFSFWDKQKKTGIRTRCQSWNLDESGYVEEESILDTSYPNLSPVHEVRERESLENEPSPANHIINRNSPEYAHQTCDNSNNSNDLIFKAMGNTSTSITNVKGNPHPQGHLNESIEAIGGKVDVIQYAGFEWQGNTTKALCIRQGYCAIPRELGISNLRRIRGDNYCAIRATLFQALSNGLPLPSSHRAYTRLVSEINRGADWLREYNFGGRLTYASGQVVDGFKECLDALEKIVAELDEVENKASVLQARLNADLHLDAKLCEGAKLHMLSCALDLYSRNLKGADLPLFALIMFARHSSASPKELLKYHLNPVGDSAGLEQIEMFLLGHALEITLQVVRPSNFSCEDFICYFPDTHVGDWPLVSLIAEDDRHYNILVK